MSIANTGNYFGFTLVQVLNSGKVILKSYGRAVPSVYTAAVTGSTTVRDSADITWK